MLQLRTSFVAGLLAFGATLTPASAQAQTPPEAQLAGRAVLPADTFAAGPPSGAQITGPTNSRRIPFPSQPVQGVSAVISSGDGAYWALSDNGFGAKNNSGDYLLRVYKLQPDFEAGTVDVQTFIQLRDPDRAVPFTIVNQNTPDRLLTGADFDVESRRQDAAGDLWFGDEFGPFLLHTDSTGRLLEAPIPLPGVKSPQNPNLASGETPNLPTSGGFEGTAISPDRRTLYPMLEAAVTTDQRRSRRFIYEFDISSRRFTGSRWQYRMDAPGNAIGDLTALDPHRLLVIERDNEQGARARTKKIYVVDLRQTDADGFLRKTEILDLLAIADPSGVAGSPRDGDIGIGRTFSFPFQTIESVLHLDGNVLLVIDDNNYPFSTGRNPSRPDDTELILVRLDEHLPGTSPGSAAAGS
jgi:hypothetical protein